MGPGWGPSGPSFPSCEDVDKQCHSLGFTFLIVCWENYLTYSLWSAWRVVGSSLFSSSQLYCQLFEGNSIISCLCACTPVPRIGTQWTWLREERMESRRWNSSFRCLSQSGTSFRHPQKVEYWVMESQTAWEPLLVSTLPISLISGMLLKFLWGSVFLSYKMAVVIVFCISFLGLLSQSITHWVA